MYLRNIQDDLRLVAKYVLQISWQLLSSDNVDKVRITFTDINIYVKMHTDKDIVHYVNIKIC